MDSGSESIFFPPLFLFGARRECRVYRTCVIPQGATLVVLLRQARIATSSLTMFRRGLNLIIVLQGPGGLLSHHGSTRYRGLPGMTTSTMFTRERFPLKGLHTSM